MRVIKSEGGVPIKMWTDGVPVEDQAVGQLVNTAALPFVHKHVAVMPDVHWGLGATIGSVIPTYGAIVPAAVGVDIGCGMCAVKLDGATANDLPDNLAPIRGAIEDAVPVGFAQHPQDSHSVQLAVEDPINTAMASWIYEQHPDIQKRRKQKPLDKILRQFGTLGGGNHFIELCIDEEDDLWVMLHSGSRGIGNMIGRYFINLAKAEMETYYINLPDKDLAYIVERSDIFHSYMFAMMWAQGYAKRNRAEMMRLVLDSIRAVPSIPPFDPELVAIDCHHNYVAQEHHFGKAVYVTRKGAVSARKDELGIIPGSMGVKSYIVKGKGNPESFHSCSHGAGRRMSRREAKRAFTRQDHVDATIGVECRKDEDVIDETPMAYKDIDAVMAAQTDLVDVVHTLKQVVCVKG